MLILSEFSKTMIVTFKKTAFIKSVIVTFSLSLSSKQILFTRIELLWNTCHTSLTIKTIFDINSWNQTLFICLLKEVTSLSIQVIITKESQEGISIFEFYVYFPLEFVLNVVSFLGEFFTLCLPESMFLPI